MIRPIVRYGDGVLARPAAPVEAVMRRLRLLKFKIISFRISMNITFYIYNGLKRFIIN